MDAYRGGRQGDPSHWPADAAGRIRMLAVPTMFSAAEFTWYAGVTEPSRLVKESFANPLFVPQVVVLDPAATLRLADPEPARDRHEGGRPRRRAALRAGSAAAGRCGVASRR